MVRLLRTWLPPVGGCLLLQGAIIGAGQLAHRLIVPESSCCASHLEL
jgi:hypothetical protein